MRAKDLCNSIAKSLKLKTSEGFSLFVQIAEKGLFLFLYFHKRNAINFNKFELIKKIVLLNFEL